MSGTVFKKWGAYIRKEEKGSSHIWKTEPFMKRGHETLVRIEEYDNNGLESKIVIKNRGNTGTDMKNTSQCP